LVIINLHIASVSITFISIILAASIVFAVSIAEFRNSVIAQGQRTNVTSSSIIPQQKAAICSPNNPKLNFVNSTESKLCGLPKSIKSNMSNITTTGPAAPSVAPTTPEPGSQ
jgi:hypothetical protein